jgi:hypothetical protein
MSDAGPQAILMNLMKLHRIPEELCEVVGQDEVGSSFHFHIKRRGSEGMLPGNSAIPGHSIRGIASAECAARARHSLDRCSPNLSGTSCRPVHRFPRRSQAFGHQRQFCLRRPSSIGLLCLKGRESEGLVQRAEDRVDHRATLICLAREVITRMIRVYEPFCRE